MATFARADLCRRVLGRLGVLDAGEAVEAEDSADVLDAIQCTLEELADEGLIPFDLEGDAIPAPYMNALSYIVALPLVDDYGKGERLQSIAAGCERGMRRLRKLKAPPYFGTPQQATYY